MAAAGIIVAMPLTIVLAGALHWALPAIAPVDAMTCTAVAVSALLVTSVASIGAAASDPSNLMRID